MPLVHEVRKGTERLLGKRRVRRECVTVALQNISLCDTQPFTLLSFGKGSTERGAIKW